MKTILLTATFLMAFCLALLPGAARAQDTDGDGKSDAEELARGSNPLLDFITPTPKYLIAPKLVQSGTNAGGAAHQVVWTGSEYIAQYNHQLYRYAADGAAIPGSLAMDGEHKMFWDGSQIALFNSAETLHVSAGLTVLDSHTVDQYARMPELWTGSEYLMLSWYSYAAYRFSADGLILGSYYPCFPGCGCDPEIIVWTGDGLTRFVHVLPLGGGIGGPQEIQVCRLSPTLVDLGCSTDEIWREFEEGEFNNYFWTGSSYFANSSYMGVGGVAVISEDFRVMGPVAPGDLDRMLAIPEVGEVLQLDDDGRYYTYTPDYENVGSLTAYPPSVNTVTNVWNGSEVAEFNWQGDSLYFATIQVGDRDGDNLPDLDETAAGTDPGNWDTDADGMGDGYEVAYTCLDPLVADDDADADGDGIINRKEFLQQADPCTAPNNNSNDNHTADCALAPAGRGAGVEVGFLVPLLAALALARARKRLRPKTRD